MDPTAALSVSYIWEASKGFSAGAAAGVIAKTSLAPLDRVKLLTQIERLRGTNRSIPRLVADVYQIEGIRAFWKGNGANCIRIIPNKGVLFACNDFFTSQIVKDHNAQITPLQRFLSGTASGAILITVTYPLDLVQCRLASGAPFDGILHCFTNTVKVEGMRGLFRGYFASVLNIAPYTGCQFGTYELCKRYFAELGLEHDPSSVSISLVAGTIAGTFAQALFHPLETIRRRLQVQGRIGEREYSGFLNCINKMYQKEGLRSFFRGIWLNAMRAGPSQGIQFVSFTFFKNLFHGASPSL